MKHFILCFIISSFQIFSQSYLNIQLSNNNYRSSSINELRKISFSTSGDVINFYLADGSIFVENTSNIKKFIFGNTPLGNPLPVELSTFTVLQIGSAVLLKWQTETEVNNFGFDIERAKTVKGTTQNWNKIGFVEGSGNSSSPKDYSFADNPDVGSKYSYRLKQIDSDGQFEYSNIVFIDVKSPNQYSLYQNYPNPFNPTTSITYNLPIDGMISLKIYDVLGREVTTLINDHQKAGIYTIPFNAAELSSGIYICKINSGSFNSSIKMILIK